MLKNSKNYQKVCKSQLQFDKPYYTSDIARNITETASKRQLT